MKRLTTILMVLAVVSAAEAQVTMQVDISKICPGVTNFVLYSPAGYTNGLSSDWRHVSTNHMDSVEHMIENGTLTNVVTRLVEEGHVCAVIGHKWGWGPTLLYDPDGGPTRHCLVCGKEESRELGPWQ